MKLHLLMSASVLTFAAANPALAANEDQAVMAAVSPTVYGRVINAEGAPLAGAEIIVRGSGVRAVSDANGQFILNVPEGQTTFDVRYIGLPNVAQTISATGGEAVSLSVTMGVVDATNLEDVIVTGVITDGIARSLNQQRNADGTINVLSSDAIGRYPDPNVAESLQRVPGIAIQRDQGEGRYINVRGAPSAFTAVSVDGVTVPAVDPGTRAVDLDTLPSDIVSNIEVSKTLLPSQDADSIAGAVNIRTRSPFDSRRLAVSGYAGGSYNDYGGEDIRGGATVSNVFGPDGTFGALLSLSYSETNRRPENIENGWTPDGDIFVIEETLFKQYETKRTRQALTGALEWRPTDQTRVYLRGSYAQFEDDEYRNTLILGYGEGDLVASTATTGTWEDARIFRNLRHRTQENDITTVVLGGEHTFGNGMVWDADLSLANSEQTYPHRDELVYRSTTTTLSYDAANHYAPTYFYEPNAPIFGDTATGFFANPANFAFRENTFRSNTTQQEDVALRTNLEIPSQFAGHDLTWKFGLKFSSRDVTADEERQRHRAPAAPNPGTLASFWGTSQGNNHGYNLGTQFNQGLVDAYLAAAKATSPRRNADSESADYVAQEDILAAYGQARFDIGATNITVGLRVEQSKFEASAASLVNFDEDNPPAIIPMESVSRDDTEFFPNLTVRHSFSDNLIGRVALTRSISRPEFSQIAPRRIENADGINIEYEIGNPDLQPTLSNNFDGGLEYYFASLGVVSANVFYKDLTDYRYILNYSVERPVAGEPVPAIDQYSRPINAPEGHLMGLELNWQQKFGFLPGWMSGFGVFANYTWTDAEIETDQFYGKDTPRNSFALPGQSENNYNVAVFYELGGFSARLSYTDRSEYLEEIDADNAGMDLWVEGRDQLDFTTSYDFGNGIELFGEAKNLTDSAGVKYYGSRERTYEYEKFGYNIFVGVRFKL